MRTIISIILILNTAVSFSQTTIQKDTDLRFRGKVVGYPSDKDAVGLMKNFTLDIQWWMFLGEPMEFYGFEWTANDHFTMDNTKVTRNQLVKYPDLLKRFHMLKPSKMTLELVGNGGTKMGLNEIFLYRIEDYKVLYYKAGVKSENLSPDSPETWYQFWKWGNEATDVDFQYKHINAVYEKSEQQFKNLPEEEQKAIIKTYKDKFKSASRIVVSDLKAHLEWPELELKSILKLYQEYEKGEKKPSPLEEVAEAEKEIANETTYTKDDFWGEVAKLEKPRLIKFKVGNLFGVKFENTTNIIIPPEYSKISIKQFGIVAYISNGDICSSNYDLNNKILFNMDGNKIIATPFEGYLETSSTGINFNGREEINGIPVYIQISRAKNLRFLRKGSSEREENRKTTWKGDNEVLKLSDKFEILHKFIKTDASWGHYRCKSKY